MNARAHFDNPDVIPLALYQLGGVGRYIDIEDIFMKCYELTPERFTWRKYEVPNYKIAAKALTDFEGKHPGLLIRTPDGLQRQLSAEGVKWIRRRLPVLNKLISGGVRQPPSRRPFQRLLNEISNHELFASYRSDSSIEPRKHEVADLLLCAPDSPTGVWRERLETLRSAAEGSNRSVLVEFLDALAHRHPEWFGGPTNAQEKT